MSARTAQEVRIIGGKWKGRKLRFTGDRTLRPTLGRTRETLFNWLRPHIYDQRCVDLFAGSGVLGLEALSQGAASSTFLDSNAKTIHALQQNIANLDTQDNTKVHHTDAVKWLRKVEADFDIAFVDPPFGQIDLLEEVLTLILERQIVRHFIYLEAPANYALNKLTDSLQATEHKSTRAGETQAVLVRLS